MTDVQQNKMETRKIINVEVLRRKCLFDCLIWKKNKEIFIKRNTQSNSIEFPLKIVDGKIPGKVPPGRKWLTILCGFNI